MQKRGTMRINVVLQSELNHPKIFQYVMLHSAFELLDHFYFAGNHLHKRIVSGLSPLPKSYIPYLVNWEIAKA